MHPGQTTRAPNRVSLVVAIVGVMLLVLLAIPTKQRCGAPGFSCETALDAAGYVHYYYEIEPVGVYLAELITGSDIAIYYKSGEDLVKAR
jgi:hypothetical protein